MASDVLPVPPALKTKLEKLGLVRHDDFILHLPIRYEDETSIVTVADALEGVPVQVEARVLDVSVQFRPRRQLVARVADSTGELVLRFLNFYGSQVKQLEQARDGDKLLRLFGEIRRGFLGAEMVHPRYRVVTAETPLPTSLTPVYPTTAGVSQAALRKLIGVALASSALDDSLDEGWCRRHALMPFSAAVRLLHAPPPDVEEAALQGRSHPAWRRVKFDEVLAQQLSLRRAYLARRQKGAPVLKADGSLRRRLLANLPFALTTAQQRVLAEIADDLAQPYPMQRLLQGDVGSGKTIVAALAACQAIEAGYQAAFMAPTEILAEQHYLKLRTWLEPFGVEVAWLTGSLRKAAKTASQSQAAGSAHLVVGTHALIQAGVDFARLGLAIVDEQHRFGVAQRLELRKKGGNPHQLMMSATPIPRTLAMSYYADLDVSVLDELPPGRTPIRTKLISDARRDQVIAGVRATVGEGRQVYWVCPLIEESEKLQLQTAIDTHAVLSAELAELRIGLVHGRLKPAEKAALMAEFVAGEIDVLVATTVIEVGVDVPNASLMVIEHAERFGLSQLHQLRGRVGRGAHDSTCVLLYQSPLSQTARSRLRIIFEHTDGFEIARQDLHLRGPGEFVGSRQSGVPLLRYADLEMDIDLVELARDLAERMLRDSPARAEAHLARWLGSREELLKA
ncbi:ATP-dependent DNA helicase RecG [Propionivibrio dicarboxylicus]|uniref:ATP-dependent DNA helicase RecG n=1 Tax=Propionivibrio dicarboxylicus TaxID=83767 RepID=A0A1G8MYJ8_9RHOO|nr:ATP-dependent DNA helicase RecG [Propionivibrio dicarboxylicus]SDI72946.1 ATP-dependent DNA helicase RecG [Propionivibrio dicarboxylicus]